LTTRAAAETLPVFLGDGAKAMSVRAIMTAEPLTLRADETIGHAVELLLQHRFIVLPVVDDRDCYLGQFDVWDLLGLLLPKAATLDKHLLPDLKFVADNLPELQARLGGLRDQPVGPIARPDLPLLRPDTPVTEALLQFYRHRSPLPVVEEGGRLVGILSYWDAIAAVAGHRG
jgi:CBS domain-containing protein